MAAGKRGVMSLTFATPGWIYAILIVVGIGIAIPAEVMFEEAWRLQMGGATVIGQVSRLWLDTHSCGHDNMQTCTSYNVAYGFDSGVWRQTQVEVSREFYSALRESGPIAVRYVVSDPTINEVEFGWTLFGAVVFLAFAAAFALVGGLFLRRRWQEVGRMVHLRETGVQRQAEVTGSDRTGWVINGQTQYAITWLDEAGILGKSLGRRLQTLPATGSQITIYADPDGKLPSVWARDSGLR